MVEALSAAGGTGGTRCSTCFVMTEQVVVVVVTELGCCHDGGSGPGSDVVCSVGFGGRSEEEAFTFVFLRCLLWKRDFVSIKLQIE